MQNLYKPDLMEVIGVRQHTPDVKSVRLRFQDAERAREFDFRVGQFGIFSAFGCGRIDVQHLLQLELARPHRILFPQGWAA